MGAVVAFNLTPLGWPHLFMRCDHAVSDRTFLRCSALEGPSPDIGICNFAIRFVATAEAQMNGQCHCWREQIPEGLTGTWTDRFRAWLRGETG